MKNDVTLVKITYWNSDNPYLKISLKSGPIIQTGYLHLFKDRAANRIFNIVSSTADGAQVLYKGYSIPFNKICSAFNTIDSKAILAACAEHTLGDNFNYVSEHNRKSAFQKDQLFSEFIDACYKFLVTSN